MAFFFKKRKLFYSIFCYCMIYRIGKERPLNINVMKYIRQRFAVAKCKQSVNTVEDLISLLVPFYTIWTHLLQYSEPNDTSEREDWTAKYYLQINYLVLTRFSSLSLPARSVLKSWAKYENFCINKESVDEVENPVLDICRKCYCHAISDWKRGKKLSQSITLIIFILIDIKEIDWWIEIKDRHDKKVIKKQPNPEEKENTKKQ